MIIPMSVPSRSKLSIIGLGNEMLSDDGLGIKVVRELRNRLQGCDVTFEELSVGGLQLFDHLIGTKECIIVDALVTGKNPPGTMFRFVQGADKEPVSLTSSHQIDLGQILGLAQFMGATLPEQLTVYGIEAEDITNFSESCTPSVADAIPRLVDTICRDIRRPTSDSGPADHAWHVINEPVTV